MNKRKGFEILYTPQQQEWRNNNSCPVCGLPKTEWTRRKDWTCCSTKCSEEHTKINIKYWPDVRRVVFKRDKYVCVKCGYDPLKQRNELLKENKELSDYSYNYFDSCFVADHIKPIACGGNEWDLSNLQTLCIKCNKAKTAKDAGDIAKQRIKDQLLRAGQRLFEDDV